jgi:ligand-binding sensor domain-containing protein
MITQAFNSHFFAKRKSLLHLRVIICICAALFPFASFSQTEIPIGTWRAHLSYNKIIAVAEGDDFIYAASEMGIIFFNKADQTIETLNKLNGLSDSGITSLAYDNVSKQLVVTYENGNVDFIHDHTVTNFSRLKDLNTIAGTKRINYAIAKDGPAWLATDYGIVVLDLARQELKETWRDLGTAGDNLRINQIIFHHDSMVLATDHGVLMGSLDDNLLDYTKWRRFDTGDLSAKIAGIASFNGKMYAAINGKGIYVNAGNGFEIANFLQQENFRSITSSANNLIVATADKLWMVGQSAQLIQISDDMIMAPLLAIEDKAGVLWIGDGQNGLVSNITGDVRNFLPNGPSVQQVFRLKYADNKMYLAPGGFTANGGPLHQTGIVDYFEDGLWKNNPVAVTDVTSVEIFADKLYAGSFGEGLVEQTMNGTQTLFNETNSPLQSLDPSEREVYIPDLEVSDAGLWVANYGVQPCLHLLKSDNTWQSFSPTNSAARYSFGLLSDQSGNIWMDINPVFGGGIVVFNPETGESISRVDGTGKGGLLNKNVLCMALDRDGNIWVGTEAGMGYFFSPTEDVVIPIFEDRFVLKDEKITAIDVDGGNRKWVGTQHGVWVFNPPGEQLVYNFTEKNSPLLSDVISDIEIDNTTGEVFIATSKGLISFRSDATAGTRDFTSVKIFPNPVTTEFSGQVGITGLATDAIVKITDTSGKLIWQTQAQGGTASWNVHDYKGKHAQTGIYIVFAATQNGTQSVVGKIAVIE